MLTSILVEALTRTRMRTIGCSLALLILASPVAAHAQAWSGILSSSRATDWSRPGVAGGVPNRTTICATLDPGATAAQINSAIAACPANQVVFLDAGTKVEHRDFMTHAWSRDPLKVLLSRIPGYWR